MFWKSAKDARQVIIYLQGAPIYVPSSLFKLSIDSYNVQKLLYFINPRENSHQHTNESSDLIIWIEI